MIRPGSFPVDSGCSKASGLFRGILANDLWYIVYPHHRALGVET